MSEITKPGRWPLHWQILAAMIIGSLIGIAANPGDQSLPDHVRVAVTRGDDGVSVEEFAVIDGKRIVLFQAGFDERTAHLENAFPALSEALGL